VPPFLARRRLSAAIFALLRTSPSRVHIRVARTRVRALRATHGRKAPRSALAMNDERCRCRGGVLVTFMPALSRLRALPVPVDLADGLEKAVDGWDAEDGRRDGQAPLHRPVVATSTLATNGRAGGQAGRRGRAGRGSSGGGGNGRTRANDAQRRFGNAAAAMTAALLYAANACTARAASRSPPRYSPITTLPHAYRLLACLPRACHCTSRSRTCLYTFSRIPNSLSAQRRRGMRAI